jgi:tRNA threonylcarbamoyl adenosine modification protein YeaZ
MRDPLILAFDTSAAHCAAALLCGDRCLVARHEDMTRGQAERLMPLLEELLTEAGATWRDLARIGVGIGPGNFTGVRIGVSTARGLALSLKIPAIGVSSLEAVAHASQGPVLAAIAAPRAGGYFEGYRMAHPVALQTCEIAALPTAWAEPGLTCIGSAAAEAAAALGTTASPATFAPAHAIARITAQRELIPGLRPAPLYLQPADAAPPADPPPVILD